MLQPTQSWLAWAVVVLECGPEVAPPGCRTRPVSTQALHGSLCVLDSWDQGETETDGGKAIYNLVGSASN